MRYSEELKAEHIRFALDDSHGRLTLLSSGAELQLTSGSSPASISSVFDSGGLIVRSAHHWLNHLERQVGLSLTDGTVEQYGLVVSYLCRWIEQSKPYGDLTVDECINLLNRHDVVNWLNSMVKGGAKASSTLHMREACLKQFLGWLTTIEGGRVRNSEDSPWGRDGTLRYAAAAPNARSPKFISAEVIVSLLNGLHNECERCMFHTQYDTGLRISELTDFRLGDIPDEANYDPAFEFIPLCVSGVKGRGGQRRERITLVSRAVLKRIKRYHSSPEYKLAPDWKISDPDKPAFLTANQLKWGLRNASKQFKSAVVRAGLPKGFKDHWLRHGTAFSVLRSDIGKSYEERMLMVQQMLGHARLKTTEIYTQIPPALLQNLTKAGNELNRLEEAEFIRAKTYLGPLQHQERRGHRD
jgi:integrase/recombinase XerD